jgi:hypothetical protein|tara:strand:+ start:185 stop:352 length:168 start_codon:yes stop_codon:yes gene_type:complete
MKSCRLFFFLIIGVVFAQNDFSLEDVNPASDTYGQNIGPSYFSNTVRVVGFFHEY